MRQANLAAEAPPCREAATLRYTEVTRVVL